MGVIAVSPAVIGPVMGREPHHSKRSDRERKGQALLRNEPRSMRGGRASVVSATIKPFSCFDRRPCPRVAQ
jgi:hypothetical protein